MNKKLFQKMLHLYLKEAVINNASVDRLLDLFSTEAPQIYDNLYGPSDISNHLKIHRLKKTFSFIKQLFELVSSLDFISGSIFVLINPDQGDVLPFNTVCDENTQFHRISRFGIASPNKFPPTNTLFIGTSHKCWGFVVANVNYLLAVHGFLTVFEIK